MSSAPGPFMEFLGQVAYEIQQMKPLLPTYIHLLVSAIFPIYTASHAALARPLSAAPAKKKEDTDINELQDEEISPTIETLTPSDAILFPILAGATLASLYFILKWLQDPALLNYYLGLYFAVVGLFFQIKFVKDALATVRSFVLPNQYSHGGRLWKVVPEKRKFVTQDSAANVEVRTSPLPGLVGVLPQHRPSLWRLRKFIYTRLRLKFVIWKVFNVTTIIDTLDIASIIIAVPLVLYHTFIDKPWFLTNLLGFSFCYGSLQITTPSTSWTGTLILSALFFYDIYFVFYTPMMVTVATKLDVPIKLLFPKPDGCVRPIGVAEDSSAWKEYLQCLAQKRTMAMLGLGDIVIPGMMLGFALRFDLYLFYHKLSASSKETTKDAKSSEKAAYLPATGSWGERFWTTSKLHSPQLQAKRFPKTYFNATVIGYVFGMIATVLVMQVSQHAQPALLYLVPGVLISLWGCALVNGDLKTLWHYSEVPEEEKSQKVDEKKDGDDKTKQIKDDKKQPRVAEVENEDSKRIAKTDSVETGKQSKDSITSKSDKTETENTSKSSESSNADENHLIHFSLSTITPTKNNSTTKPQSDTNDDAEQASVQKPITEASSHAPQVLTAIESDESSDWSSEGIEDENSRNVVSSDQSKTAKSADMSTGMKDTEPAVKRRRKA